MTFGGSSDACSKTTQRVLAKLGPPPDGTCDQRFFDMSPDILHFQIHFYFQIPILPPRENPLPEAADGRQISYSIIEEPDRSTPYPPSSLTELERDAMTSIARKREVGQLLQVLEDGRARNGNDGADVLDVLTRLKVYGRDPSNAEAMYCKGGISLLGEYAFAGPTSTSREALRCLANALLLAPNLRQDFIDLELVPKAAERLQSEDLDDEFLVSRIILLLTYDTSLNQDELLWKFSLASSINRHLLQHARVFVGGQEKSQSTGMDVMALSETLKLLFNLSARQDNAIIFQPAIKPILSILSGMKLPSRCLDPPINFLINTLVNLDISHAKASEFIESTSLSEMDGHTLVEKLSDVLEKSLKSYTDTELETCLPPLLTVLRKVYDFGGENLRTHMQDTLLPVHEDREVPIGKLNTLPSRLLRLSSSAMAPQLREIIPALLFEISDQDPEKFIENIGYGFAAGFLASHNIAMPQSAKQALRPAKNGSDELPLNPITGQRLDREPEDEGPPMTMEEKEREAERLFVLFERLNATGVVNVQNPVHRAMNDGKLESRIEEVDDSD
jgi:hypothetical protein